MRSADASQTTVSPPPPGPRKRPSTFKNVATSWVWQLIVLISGFILPRQIDEHLGPELLGVWDFGWSWVFYVRNLHMGISASVNRYTARHRALQEWTALNDTLNTSIWLMTGMALVGCCLAAGFALATPFFLPKQPAAIIAQAQWVVFILGVSSAQQLIGSVFDAGLAGFERWDLLNWLRGARDTFLIVAIIALLYAGFGLVATSLVVLVGHILCDASLFLVLRRLFPQLHLSVWRIHRRGCAELILFGGKTVVREVLRGAVYQVNAVYVSSWLGLGALAVFSRQRTLLTHLITFIKQYAHVFVPASSALHAASDKDALRNLLIRSSQYGFYVSLPPIIVLLFAGGDVIDLWMGPGYRNDIVLAVLTLCHLPLISQLSVYAVLVGMDRHGRAAVYEFFGAIASIALGYVLVGVAGYGLIGASVAIGAPLLVVGGVILPLDACRTLGLSPLRYAAATMPKPLLLNAPFAAVLLAAEFTWPNHPLLSLLVGGSLGGVLLGSLYWRFVAPDSLRSQIRGRATRLLGARSLSSTATSTSATEPFNQQAAP
ncbi:MAG: oligosaccharide flippase family protein [Phycisphaerales bacterium]|nr:oligosaccharide flippase family protein [Phycisphaerales bacterium]